MEAGAAACKSSRLASGREEPERSRGAYGFRIAGHDDDALRDVPAAFPLLEVGFDEPGDGPLRVSPRQPLFADETQGEAWLGDGDWLSLRREPLRLVVRTRAAQTPSAVTHPLLALPAAVAAHWLGRRSFHGGAFRFGDRTWAVLGGPEAGKSSTLARLRLDGHPVVSDDVLVLDGTAVYAGPAAVDLREHSAERMGGRPLGEVGGRERWRLPGGDAPIVSSLAGFVLLAWGDEPAVEGVGFADLLRALVESSVIRPAAEDSAPFFELASLPAVRLVRPRDLGRLTDATDMLLASLM